MPRLIYQTEEPADQEKMVKVLAEAARIGMEITIDYAHEVMQIPRAAEGEPILKAASRSPFPAPDEAEEEGEEDAEKPRDKAKDKARAAASAYPYQWVQHSASIYGHPVASLSRAPDADPDDPVSQAAEQLQAAAAPEIEGWLETIKAMLNAASSLEEFRAMLLAAWPELPTDRLVAVMAEAFAAMELRGMADVQDKAGGGA
jgi:phage gp29-like protein